MSRPRDETGPDPDYELMHRRVPYFDKYADGILRQEQVFEVQHPFHPAAVSERLPGDQTALRIHAQRPFIDRSYAWKRKRGLRLRRQIEEKNREEMAECSFQPVISNFPQDETDRRRSYRRSLAKARGRVKRQRALKEKKIRQECTFQPNVDPKKASANVSKQKPKGSDRKNRNVKAGRGSRGGAMRRASSTVVSRSRNPFKSRRGGVRRRGGYDARRPGRVYSSRSRVRGSGRAVRGVRGRRSGVMRTGRLRRGRLPTDSDDESDDSDDENSQKFIERMSKPRPKVNKKDDPECTFQPSINDGYFRQRPAASNLYLRRNAFDRLSKKPSTSSSSRILDINQRRASTPAGRSTSSMPGAASAPPGGRVASASASSSVVKKAGRRRFATPVGMSRRGHSTAVRVDAFLKRNAEAARMRKQRLDALKSSVAPSHRPMINPKSKKLLKSQVSFLDRMEYLMHKARRRKADMEQESAASIPFQPEINEVSKKMKPRSYDEMWKDFSRSKQRIEIERKLLDAKKMKEATFKPKITKKAKRVDENKLLASARTGYANPDGYMQRIRVSQRRQERQRKEAERRRGQSELEECTFQPKTKPVPRFIRQVAASYGLSKKRRKVDYGPKPFRF